METNPKFNLIMDDLLISYVIGEISEEERNKVETWIAENNENRHYFEQLRDIYSIGRSLKSPSGFDAEKSLTRIKSQYYKIRYNDIQEKVALNKLKRRRTISILAAAASVMLLVSLGLNLRSWIGTPQSETNRNIAGNFNEIVSPLGSRTQVTLPDGSQVWLNAGSTLKYPMNFLDKDRMVVLSGEAFFDVTELPGRRFIVNTSEIAVRVWGTKFNVKAYPDELTIQTTLVEGSVSIQEFGDKNNSKETYLVPNQTAVFYKHPDPAISSTRQADVPVSLPSAEIPVEIHSEVNTILHTSWKDKNWHIEEESLKLLARELERRYNVKIRFADESVMNHRFTGIIADETIEQILEFIRVSAPVNYEINNNEILLTHNKGSKSKFDEYLNRNNK